MRRSAPSALTATLAALVVLAGVTLGACSDDEVAVSVGAAGAAPAAPDPTGASTAGTVPVDRDATPADAGPAASPSSAADGPLVAPIELDPCLVGEWRVSLETIQLLIAAAVLPVPDLTVADGGFTVTLDDDGGVEGVAAFTAAFSLGTTPAEADVDWTGTGTWSTVDGAVTIALTRQQGGLTELRLDGAAQAGSELAADLPLAGGDYTCAADRLEVTASAGGTTVPLVFER
jgi:hypothetical protein